MTRALQLAVFSAVALLITGLIHYYFWTRLVRGAQMPLPLRRGLGLALILLALGVPLTLVLSHLMPPSGRGLLMVGNAWLGLMWLLFVFTLGTDLVRLVTHVTGLAVARGSTPQSTDLSRRRHLGGWLAAAAALGTSALGGTALRRVAEGPRLRTVTVPLPGLPPQLDGFTIVQLTDLHLGATLQADFARNVVEVTNSLSPDLVAVTGDLVDGEVHRIAELVAPLAELRATHGVYFVTGNHDFYSDVEPWLEFVRARLGWRVLANERVRIGDDNTHFELAGVHDYAAGRFGQRWAPNLPKALDGWRGDSALVLLAHQPLAVLEAARHKVDLVLSGHTHGGQIWPWGHLVRLQQPVVEGLARFGDTRIYVSPGTGYWGPPMRLGTRSEITRIVLRSVPRGAPLPDAKVEA